MVKLIADKLNVLISEFNGPVDMQFDDPQHPRHPDLLPVFHGDYVLTGMVAGDRLTITYRVAPPKPEPIRLSEYDVARLRAEARREMIRQRPLSRQTLDQFGNIIN